MLEVPNEVTQAMRLPPQEAEAHLRLELAIGLYTQRIVPLGKVAQLAGLNRWEFGGHPGPAWNCRAIQRRGLGARRGLCRPLVLIATLPC